MAVVMIAVRFFTLINSSARRVLLRQASHHAAA
jgi:hypothetical protein